MRPLSGGLRGAGAFRGHLTVKFSDGETDEYDGEMMWISPSESEVDLAQYIYESIVLSLPYQRVHPEGECDPAMLERFRIVSDSEFAAIEARADAGAGCRGARRPLGRAGDARADGRRRSVRRGDGKE